MSGVTRSSSSTYDVLRLVVEAQQRGLSVLESTSAAEGSGGGRTGGHYPDDLDPEGSRIAALVDLARAGDTEAFGALYDHYSPGIYRFVYFRVRSPQLAEDLTSETFFKALRSMASFQWQGKDFGAWLTTIARNLVFDYFKSSRARLETVSDEVDDRRSVVDGPEEEVLARLTRDVLHDALMRLSVEQRECLVLRFLNGQSTAEVAKALGRSEGAVKQLQLRAVRNLAKLIPEDAR